MIAIHVHVDYMKIFIADRLKEPQTGIIGPEHRETFKTLCVIDSRLGRTNSLKFQSGRVKNKNYCLRVYLKTQFDYEICILIMKVSCHS